MTYEFTIRGLDQCGLEATDLEAVLQATRPPLPVESLPGGSVSFLFERSSKTPLEDMEDTVPDDGEESV